MNVKMNQTLDEYYKNKDRILHDRTCSGTRMHIYQDIVSYNIQHRIIDQSNYTDALILENNMYEEYFNDNNVTLVFREYLNNVIYTYKLLTDTRTYLFDLHNDLASFFNNGQYIYRYSQHASGIDSIFFDDRFNEDYLNYGCDFDGDCVCACMAG